MTDEGFPPPNSHSTGQLPPPVPGNNTPPPVDMFGNAQSPFGAIVEGRAQSFADFANNGTVTSAQQTENMPLPPLYPVSNVPGFEQPPAVVAKQMIVGPDSVLTVPDSALAKNNRPIQNR